MTLSMLITKNASNNLTVIERMALLPDEAVSHAVHCFHIMGLAGRRLDLGAQVLDVQIDGAFVTFITDPCKISSRSKRENTCPGADIKAARRSNSEGVRST